MRRPRRRYEARPHVRAAEMLLFVAVSALGVYALGNGLSGLFEPGKSVQLAWVAVLAVTLLILFAQMGRVHDAWPRRHRPEPPAARPAARDESKRPSLWRRLIRDDGEC
jgi:hypothetical protein